MDIWVALQLAALVATFGSIVWGVLKFFIPPSRYTGKAAALSVVALAGFANQLAATWSAPHDPVRGTLALVSYIASMVLFWSAVHACAKRPLTAIYESDTPVRIVVNAPYSLIRHPFYTSYSLFWIAGLVGSGAWSTAATAATMIAVYVNAARAEEAKFAASPLAAAYADYRRRVGFFFPRVPLASSMRDLPISLSAAWRSR